MTVTTLPAEALAVLSTAHLPEHEVNTLTEMLNNGQAIGMLRTEGFMIYVNPIEAVNSESLEYINFIMGYLKASDFVWVMFDRDADTVQQFRTFEW